MKKIFTFFVALTLSVGLWAVNGVKYIDAYGVEQTANNVTEITNSTIALSAGWYIVLGTDVQTGSLTCSGAVNLILADGAKLTATGTDKEAGIRVYGTGNSLTIYGQTNRSGQLIANGGKDAAGIGGNDGLKSDDSGDGSNITINGGIIEANGVNGGAGIGGGEWGNGLNFTINGGKVTANGGGGCAGIGGGASGSGSKITINGGEVTANGGDQAAGIGGGTFGSGSDIIINGGIVEANGGRAAAGIGGGVNGSGSNITISGGTITANGGVYEVGELKYIGDGIGNGYFSESPELASNIKAAISLIVKAGDSENPFNVIAATRTANQDIASDLAGKQYATVGAELVADVKKAAIEEIDAAIEDVTDDAILNIANTAKTNIADATTGEEVISIKEKALADIATALFTKLKTDAIAEITSAREGIKNTDINNWIDAAIHDIQSGDQNATPSIDEIKEQILYIINLFQNGKAEGFEEGDDAGYARGKEDGKAAVFGTMSTPQNGPAVIVTDQDDKQIILYSPKKVQYIKVTNK